MEAEALVQCGAGEGRQSEVGFRCDHDDRYGVLNTAKHEDEALPRRVGSRSDSERGQRGILALGRSRLQPVTLSSRLLQYALCMRIPARQ